MPYAFTQTDSTVAAALRRIAHDQIDGALAGLDNEAAPLAPRVHGARKAVKKTRGLIRLVRPVFPAYAAENAALRDAGRAIASLREAEVLLTVFDRLAQDAGLKPAEVVPLRAPFLTGVQTATDPAMQARSVEDFRQRMTAIRIRIDDWHLKADGFRALAPGLERTLAAARAAARHALANPDAETIHDWRKRVKDHWYQARLLTPVWPEMMAPHVAAADTLGELLGDHHDLADLSLRLADLPPSDPRDTLLAAAAARQSAMEHEAHAMGRRLLADEPQALADRWRVWWKVWRG